jgi:hypothetical protein
MTAVKSTGQSHDQETTTGGGDNGYHTVRYSRFEYVQGATQRPPTIQPKMGQPPAACMLRMKTIPAIIGILEIWVLGGELKGHCREMERIHGRTE